MRCLTYKQEWFARIFLLTTVHVNTFKLARVLRTASHFFCHDSIHEARLGVNEVDTGEGWRFKEEWTGQHALETLRDEIYEA
jgi:hypothetical protein